VGHPPGPPRRGLLHFPAMPNESASNYYNFVAECPHCGESRGVSCSLTQVVTGEPIEVYAVQCDHTWRLTPDDSRKLRENTDLLR
jgi:hypothetical protein